MSVHKIGERSISWVSVGVGPVLATLLIQSANKIAHGNAPNLPRGVVIKSGSGRLTTHGGSSPKNTATNPQVACSNSAFKDALTRTKHLG